MIGRVGCFARGCGSTGAGVGGEPRSVVDGEGGGCGIVDGCGTVHTAAEDGSAGVRGGCASQSLLKRRFGQPVLCMELFWGWG